MKYEKSCGAVVYIRTKYGIQYLTVKSIKNGHWGFPKGHVEKGENEYETAIREIFEETGLVVNIADGFRKLLEYAPTAGINKEVVYFIGRATDQEVSIQAEEIEAYKWADFHDTLQILSFNNTKEILAEANRFLLENGI